MREGGCVPSIYPIPPESFKVEVEDGNATETTTDGELPEGIKQTGLVKLDGTTVRIRGRNCGIYESDAKVHDIVALRFEMVLL